MAGTVTASESASAIVNANEIENVSVSEKEKEATHRENANETEIKLLEDENETERLDIIATILPWIVLEVESCEMTPWTILTNQVHGLEREEIGIVPARPPIYLVLLSLPRPLLDGFLKVTTFPAARELGGALDDRDLGQMVAMDERMEVVGVALGQVGRERAWWIGYDDWCVCIGFFSFYCYYHLLLSMIAFIVQFNGACFTPCTSTFTSCISLGRFTPIIIVI